MSFTVGPTRHVTPKMLALAAISLLVAGCTPALDGHAGVMRDHNGQLLGIWQGCAQDPTEAQLVEDPYSDNSVHVGSWKPRKAQKAATFALQPSTVPPGWRTWQPGPQTFRPGHVYSLDAWVKRNDTNTLSVEFTTDDLATLEPGDVLVNLRGDPERVITLQQFEVDSCPDSTNPALHG